MTTADLDTHYKDLGEIVNDSDIVAEVKIKDNAVKKEYEGATFITNQVEIKDIVVGDSSLKGKEITLLELGFSENDSNISKNNTKYLLFLTKYEGPIIEDGYVVTGVYQGKFKVNNDDSLDYVGNLFNGVEYFQKDFKKLKLGNAKEKIKSVK